MHLFVARAPQVIQYNSLFANIKLAGCTLLLSFTSLLYAKPD